MTRQRTLVGNALALLAAAVGPALGLAAALVVAAGFGTAAAGAFGAEPSELFALLDALSGLAATLDAPAPPGCLKLLRRLVTLPL